MPGARARSAVRERRVPMAVVWVPQHGLHGISQTHAVPFIQSVRMHLAHCCWRWLLRFLMRFNNCKQAFPRV